MDSVRTFGIDNFDNVVFSVRGVVEGLKSNSLGSYILLGVKGFGAKRRRTSNLF